MCEVYYLDMEIVYWSEKITKFISDLDMITATRVRKTISFLEQFGYLLGILDSKSLGKGLFELRTLGRKHVRILYVFHANKIYIVHGFIKKTWKISSKDIEYVRNIQKEIEDLV